MNVPDIGSLLGKISEKREEMPKTPVQAVQPVDEKIGNQELIGKKVKTRKRQNTKTFENNNSFTPKQDNLVIGERGVGGRPTVKKESVEYVKMSPRIPKALKKEVDIALINEQFVDRDGQVIKTLDEIVAHALEELLSS